MSYVYPSDSRLRIKIIFVVRQVFCKSGKVKVPRHWSPIKISCLAKRLRTICKIISLYSRSKLINVSRITAEWSSENGWAAPELRPYDKIRLDPSATVFHYASEVRKLCMSICHQQTDIPRIVF